MSIIYDALKKVGQKVELPNSPVALPQSAPQAVDLVGKNQFKSYFVIIGILVAGVVVASLVFKLIESIYKKNTVIPSSPVVVAPPQAPTAILSKGQAQDIQEALKVEIAQPTKAEDIVVPSFVLNGIFFSEDKGYALINNQISKVGDLVSGALVKEISSNQVELEYSGKSIVLK